MKKLSFLLMAIVGFGLLFSPNSASAVNHSSLLTLRNSQNSWSNLPEGSRLTVYFDLSNQVTESDYQLGVNIYNQNQMTGYCFGTFPICEQMDIDVLRGGTYRIEYTFTNKVTGKYVNETKKFTVKSSGENTKPTASITASGTPYPGSSDFYIDVKGQGNGWKLTHIYLYRHDIGGYINHTSCNLQKTCSYRITPSFTSSDVGKTFYYSADLLDETEYRTRTNVISFTVQAKPNSIAPTVEIKSKGTAYVNTSGQNGVYIQAIARGTNLSTIKIIRTDSTGHTVTNPCTNMRTTCAMGIYPTFTAEQAGKTYAYQAIITDSAGRTSVSEVLTVRVVAKNTPTPTATPSLPQGNLNPVLGTVPSTLGVNQTATISGTATNAHGVWGVEVRALPSWSNVALKNRCILNNKPTTGSCSLNIGSFAGHVGQTVKVWVIYWDARTGLGYTSEMRTITLTK